MGYWEKIPGWESGESLGCFGTHPAPPKLDTVTEPCCCWGAAGIPPGSPKPHSPLPEEGTTSILDVLQLQETRPHEQGLHILLVYGQVTVVGKVDQSLQCTKSREKGQKMH